MKKILFIFPVSPLAFNYSGAASRYAQNFFALRSLGVELHTVRFGTKKQLQSILDFEKTSTTARLAKNYSSSWNEIEINKGQTKNIRDTLHNIFLDPVEYEFPCYKLLAEQIALLINKTSPDLIWAEHSESAASIWHLAPSLRWIYSSHDLRYLVRKVRNLSTNPLHIFLNQVSRKIENKISRSANLIITGSSTEAYRLKKIGCQNIKIIPMITKDFPEINLENSPKKDVQVVHLGSLETTANRNGLVAYLSKAHAPLLKQFEEIETPITLLIIGDCSHVKPPLSELLLQPGIKLSGYIPDLTSALRPYDIAILPYTQDSGYRTKLPLLMGYAQVIVATRNAVSGSLIPGLEEVCIILENVEEFPDKIAWLAMHPEERKRLGLAGRVFAQNHFSMNAVFPLYDDLIRQVN